MKAAVLKEFNKDLDTLIEQAKKSVDKDKPVKLVTFPSRMNEKDVNEICENLNKIYRSHQLHPSNLHLRHCMTDQEK